MFRSATVKLTLWYVLLAAALCLAYSVVVYQISTDELDEALNRQYHSYIDNDSSHDDVPPPYEEIQDRGQSLFVKLAWFNVIVIGGSSVIGYFLARRTLKPIETAHKAQTRFTAEASHELRTPLAAMHADTEVALMEKGLTGQARRTLQGNLRDIERLERLTAHLLDIARHQGGATKQQALLDFDELVRHAVRQLGRTASQKHVRIEQAIKPAQVMGDQRTLEQLITTVLDNAIKYSHEGGVITLSLAVKARTMTLTITDKGVGIPVDDLSHIFEYFYRSHNARSKSGYGLGLPLAQAIVKAHGGTIDIQSREHDGTNVRITLPTASAQE